MTSQKRGDEREENDIRKPHKVVALEGAMKEAKKTLNKNQYAQVVEIVKRLRDFGNPQATADLDIKPFNQHWELCLKGGFLGKLNIRVYFGFNSNQVEIVWLKTYKKEEDRRVGKHVPITVEDRFEQYVKGTLAYVTLE